MAYAKRKSQEFNIQNVDYMQADILNLKKLGKQFDIIESAGVLHHMNDPMAGWKVLTDCLKPGGLMRIALYSDLARQSVVKIRAEIARSGSAPTIDNIISFRKRIIAAEDKFSEQIKTWSDFYSVSELRDLLFHVQEHRFTLSQIKDCLAELGLQFCGFESERNISKFKALSPKKDSVYDLEQWQIFERNNPNIFTGMYQFWCQKVR